ASCGAPTTSRRPPRAGSGSGSSRPATGGRGSPSSSTRRPRRRPGRRRWRWPADDPRRVRGAGRPHPPGRRAPPGRGRPGHRHRTCRRAPRHPPGGGQAPGHPGRGRPGDLRPPGPRDPVLLHAPPAGRRRHLDGRHRRPVGRPPPGPVAVPGDRRTPAQTPKAGVRQRTLDGLLGGGPVDVDAAPAGLAVGFAADLVGGVEQALHGRLLVEALGQQQGDGAGDVGGGHRRAGQVGVGVLLAADPERREDVVGLLGVGGTARGGHRPLGPAGRRGVAGRLVVGAGGADDDGVHVAVVRALEPEAGGVRVAGGDDRDGTVAPGVVDPFLQFVLADQEVEQLGRIAERQVDDLGAVVDDPLDPADHVGPLAGALGPERLGHHEHGTGGDAGDALAVVGDGGGDTADVRAVALVVLGAALALGLVAAGADAAGRGHDLAGEVLVGEVDAGVDDPDAHAGAGRARPRLLGADVAERPLVLEERVVRRPRPHHRHDHERRDRQTKQRNPPTTHALHSSPPPFESLFCPWKGFPRSQSGGNGPRLQEPAGASAFGRSTSTARPPPGRGRAVTRPPWAAATDRTIDRPRPAPDPEPARRSLPRRRNGSNSPSTSAASITGPVLATASRTSPGSAPRPVSTSSRPPDALCRMAFSIKLPARRPSSAPSPVVGAGSKRPSVSTPAAAAWASASRASPARSTGPRTAGPRSERASRRRPSISALLRSVAWRTISAIRRSSSGGASGSARATSTSVRMIDSGVRSSWEALATKRFWLSNAASRRPSMASKVSASSFSSSSGPSRPMRSWRFSSDRRRAVAVMRCRGWSTRPAMAQPKPTDSTAMTASPCNDFTTSSWSVWFR